MAIPRCSTGFSTGMSCDIYHIRKTEQATEDKEVDVLDRGCKNCMSACAGVGFEGVEMEPSVFLQCLVREGMTR